MSQRNNTPERRDMLAARAEEQRSRAPGFRAPDGRSWRREPVRIVPAWMNRRTGEPHTDQRFKARGHTHDRFRTNMRVAFRYPEVVTYGF